MNKKNVKNGCDGKVKHKSLLSAQLYLENSTQRENQKIYQCRSCKNYHIGKTKQAKKNPAKPKRHRETFLSTAEKPIKVKKMRL